MFIIAKDIITKIEIIQLFNKFIKNFKLDIVYDNQKIRHYNGSYPDSTITYINNLDFNTDIITEYFIEDIRINCENVNFKLSPIKYYNLNKKKIDTIFKNLIQKLNIKQDEKLRKYYIFKNLIKKHLIRDCDVFPLFVPLSIYCTFKPRSVLDMSSGWGDRLIGAIAYGECDYQGVDPNSKLQEKYKNIVDTLTPKNSTHTYSVIKSPFEEIKLTQKYDMMFSSPPYFIAEKYSNNNNQSFKKHPQITKWLKKFMYKSIDIIWTHLNAGGYLIMVINDVRIKKDIIHYTENILSYIASKKGSKFINMLKYKTKHTIQPIWCFQKLFPINNSIFNKPFVIQPFKYNGNTFNVIREDLLIGGSKQRVIGKIIDTIKEKHLFYRGPVNGYAQLALAYGCFVKGKICHIILNKQYDNNQYIITKLGKIFNAIIHEIPKPTSNNFEKKEINNIIKNYQDSYIFPLGFHTPLVIKTYSKIFQQLKKLINPKRLWITASSGTIVDALIDIFPNTIFNVVFVGHIRNYNNKRINIYVSSLHFREHTKNIPPYRSELSYDGKAWEFVKKYGKDGDYIFNVGGIC